MNRPYPLTAWALAVAAVVFAAAPAVAADRIKLKNGKQSSGELAESSAKMVAMQVGATKREFPVNEIESVQFNAEPIQLSQARIAVRGGRYEHALKELAKIGVNQMKRPEIAKDVDFYKALAAARMALAGSGSIAEAGKRMFVFQRNNPNSFHYFEACEALGDLLAARGSFGDAEGFYDKLAQAPWPDYKMRAGVLVGRALVRQKKFDQAAAKFDEVLQTEASGPQAEAQKSAATLGKAAAISGTGKTLEAIKLVDGVIAKADADDEQLHARAYNVLGNCYHSAGKNKEALLAFLHVDLLYSQFADQHAEALANLAELWGKLDKSQRAKQAANLLKEKYPNSTWAAK